MTSPAKFPVTMSVPPTFADDVMVTGAVNTPPVVVIPDGVPVVLFPPKLIVFPDIPTPLASESVRVVAVTLNALPHFTDAMLKIGAERDVTCFVICIVLLEEDAR